jgi:hypothetical protein
MPTTTLSEHIIQLARRNTYFSVENIEAQLKRRRMKVNHNTLKQNLIRLKKKKIIFDAGRGWYSSVPTAFALNTAPIQQLANDIKAGFPLLKFCCWSTQQLQSFAHHMMTKFAAFVYAEIDLIPSIAEHLDGKGYHVFPNPTKSEVKKYFALKERTCILRPSITEEPTDNSYATIEKILVDLYVEKDRVYLIDGAEYKRIFNNVVTSQRINMGRLLRYAKRREVKETLTNHVLKEGIIL